MHLLYGHLSKSEEQKMEKFERKVLKKIYEAYLDAHTSKLKN